MVFDEPDETHACIEQRRHRGIAPRPEAEGEGEGEGEGEELYGAAILRIDRRGGRWWAHNEEYATEVSFCPWCGRRLSDS